MEPIYEFRDESRSLSVLIVICGIMMIAMAFLTPMDPKAPAAVNWGLKIVLLFFGGVTFVFTPVVRIKAFDDRLHIAYGYTKLASFNLAREKIVSIRAVQYNPMIDFGGWGVKGGAGKWKGWTAFTASISNKALAIETTEKKYLVGCRDPDEAETMLRNLYGLKPGQIGS